VSLIAMPKPIVFWNQKTIGFGIAINDTL